MSGSMGDMGNLLKQAQQMQAEIDKIRTELKQAILEGASPDGMVTVSISGELHVQAVEISPELIKLGDASRVESSVLAALRNGVEKAEAVRTKNMSRVTGGMNLPGLF
ncbi:MAG: DNA-binding YbaB/EbfC family protein [Planctomycetota bacterium]|jgi:DNA-binding YbaB/EbfC family protein